MAEPTLENVAPDSSAIERYEQEQPNAIAIRSLDDIKRLSLIFVESGMFKGDARLDAQTKMYQAGVKIIAGVEFGIQPFAAMRGINIINGNAEMSANLMAAKVKKHPKYDYRVTKWDIDGCVIEFYELPHPSAPRKEWDKLGKSSFDKLDATRAGLTGGNWQKFARNMYFARAMSNGVRIYTPDVFYGAPVYVEGEISGQFDDKPQAAPEPAEAEIVDAAAPDVDQMGSPQPSRTDTKAAVEAVEAEVNAKYDEQEVLDIMTEDEPTTQWDAHEAATTDEPKTSRRLDPKKTQRIYKLGRELGLDKQKLIKRVDSLQNNQEADEAIAILEEDLAKKGGKT